MCQDSLKLAIADLRSPPTLNLLSGSKVGGLI